MEVMLKNNIYLWKKIPSLTTSYHSGGGLLVIARDRDRVDELVNAKNGQEYGDGYVNIKIDKEPFIFIRCLDDVEETIILFPDMGCC